MVRCVRAGLYSGLLLAAAACQSPGVSAPAASASAAAARPVALTIRTDHGRRRFEVEVARSDAEQERGLMFRKSLAPDAGMLFPMRPVRVATFWMKNTLIPLDIVFIRSDHSIARIAANATPESLDIIDSGEPVSDVLEIAGGRAAALGIKAGDRVSW